MYKRQNYKNIALKKQSCALSLLFLFYKNLKFIFLKLLQIIRKRGKINIYLRKKEKQDVYDRRNQKTGSTGCGRNRNGS